MEESESIWKKKTGKIKRLLLASLFFLLPLSAFALPEKKKKQRETLG